MKELYVELSDKGYPIYIEKGIFGRLGKEIAAIHKGKKIAAVTDENLALLYGESLMDSLIRSGFEARLVVIRAGEKSKSIQEYLRVCDELMEFGITRSDLIVAFGGGVTGDLAGFAASTLLRGVKYIQVPTSLLAQVDSSVGGKVAIDHPRGKNLLGSFYHPQAVFIDPQLLETLEERYFSDGLAEVIKYACISSRYLFEMLEEAESVRCLKVEMEDIIFTCCRIKSEIVKMDERDKGERMLLNFGHTIGHAIERYHGYEKFSHGEAVAAGMHMMTIKTEEEGLTQKGTSERIKKLLNKYSLPLNAEAADKSELPAIIARDKKSDGDELNIVVLSEIGNAFLKKIKKEEILRYL